MKIGLETVILAYLACIAILIFVRNPSWLLYLMIVIPASGYLRDMSIAIGPVDFYSKDIVLMLYILAVAAFLFKKATNRSKLIAVPDDARSLVLLILVYISMHMTFMVLAYLQGVPLDTTIRRFLTYADCLYFFFPTFFLRDTRKIKNVILFISYLSVFYLGWQIFSYILLGGASKQYITSSQTVRLTGSHMIPILGCGMFILLLWGGRIRGYFLSIFPVLSILLIGHRSGYIALATGLLLLFFFTKKIGKGMLYIYSGLFVVVVSLIGLEIFSGHSFVDDVANRSSDTFNFENKSSVGRLYAIGNNFFVFKKKPIAGIGYNHESLRKMFPPWTPAGQKKGEKVLTTIGEYNVLQPHNFVMRFLSHTGIVGTCFIFSIIGLVLKRCYSFFRTGGMLRDTGIFLFCSIFFLLTMSLMNTTFFSNGFIFWILCGTIPIFQNDIGQGVDNMQGHG